MSKTSQILVTTIKYQLRWRGLGGEHCHMLSRIQPSFKREELSGRSTPDDRFFLLFAFSCVFAFMIKVWNFSWPKIGEISVKHKLGLGRPSNGCQGPSEKMPLSLHTAPFCTLHTEHCTLHSYAHCTLYCHIRSGCTSACWKCLQFYEKFSEFKILCPLQATSTLRWADLGGGAVWHYFRDGCSFCSKIAKKSDRAKRGGLRAVKAGNIISWKWEKTPCWKSICNFT